ncbi:hypothetical protein AF72_01195 [Xylella taiwanensis]|uniref:Uncharacterized protein n=1 Tax=Xylella taiwanensis TaxID=1444770 RepID=Z9JN51_9GAMM|nr:hypothetical protein AF72_01195 [Xylella taiwanensis]
MALLVEMSREDSLHCLHQAVQLFNDELLPNCSFLCTQFKGSCIDAGSIGLVYGHF